MVNPSSAPRSISVFCGMISGGSSETNTAASVTIKVPESLCKNAASQYVYWFQNRGGSRSSFVAISSRQGAREPSASSSPAGKIPKNWLGRFAGNENWPGATHTCAFGNRRANGPTKILCSYCVVASTTYATSTAASFAPEPQCFSSNSRHSPVGAIGSCTHSRPSRSFTTVITTLVLTPRPSPMPCSCSNVHTRPGTSVLATVLRLSKGVRGKGNPVTLTYRRFAAASSSSGEDPSPLAETRQRRDDR
mmetsp:Transcript_14940/g.64033  ORF Transcript_14940/g.64033 Transcript_14940/m.64033 type:complete len:249 (+) Transcript_14940:529-1275(+)